MQDAKRSILDRVVQGTLSPDEAAAELEQLEAQQPQATMATATAPESGARPGPSNLAGVRVINQMGSVIVIGDPTVQDAVAQGPHSARREGDILVIEVAPLGSRGGSFVFGGVGVQVGDGRRLTVRMNPALALEADVQAGSLKIHQLTGPIRATVQAGSTTVEDCEGPYAVMVSAGSFKARTRVTGGNSTIQCDAGSVKMHLLEGSSCRITAQTTMGKISLPGGHQSGVGFGDQASVTIGGGSGTLDIRSSMGSVQVSSDQ